MQRLFVLGDSISIQYGPFLEKFTEGKFKYDRKGKYDVPDQDLNKVSKSNGGDSAHVLEYLKTRQPVCDVLLLNSGLHDIKITDGCHQVELPDYRKNLIEILHIATVHDWKLVWVNSTPVADDIHNSLCKAFTRRNSDLLSYNAAAEEIMRSQGVQVIDLYHFTASFGEDAYIDHVHYKENVRQLQAAYIAGAINWFPDISNV